MYLSSALCLLHILVINKVTSGLDIYSAVTSCNKTIYLDSKLYAGYLNFSHKPGQPFKFPGTKKCNILLKTRADDFVAVNVFPHTLNLTRNKNGKNHIDILTMTSNDVNVGVNETFPEREVISRSFLNLEYEIHSDYDVIMFEYDVLFYSFHFKGTTSCHGNATVCANSLRCVQESLSCSEIYDFCANGYQNCNPIIKATPANISMSYYGVLIFVGCLVVLVVIMTYMCFCRNIVSYYKYSRGKARRRRGAHSAMADQPRDQPEPEELDDDDEENGDDIDVGSAAEIQDDADEEDDTTEVLFGLPPSYSYIEQHDSLDESRLENDRFETCTSLFERSPTSTTLPPSYSTVLHHETEYNVHVY